MSWFDSSFSFARTALSQAQKSIDKVLDIQDEQKEHQEPSDQESLPKSASLKDVPSTSPSASPSSEKPKATQSLASSTPKPHVVTKKSASVAHTHSLSNTPVVASPISQDSFTSTWGGADSLWSSLTSTPSKKEQVKPVGHSERPTATGVKQSKRITEVTTKQKGGAKTSPSPKPSPPPSSSSARSDSEQERESKTAPPGSQHSVRVSTSSTDSQSNEGVGEKQVAAVSTEAIDTPPNIRAPQDVPLSISTVRGSRTDGALEQLDSNQPAIMSPSSTPQEPSSPHSDSHNLPTHHFAGKGDADRANSPSENVEGSVSEDVTQTTGRGNGVVSNVDEPVKEEGEKAGGLVALLETTDGTETESTTLGKGESEVKVEATFPQQSLDLTEDNWSTKETVLTEVLLSHTHHTPTAPPLMEQHTLLESIQQPSTSTAPHFSPLSPLPISHSPLPPSTSSPEPSPSPSGTTNSTLQTQEVHVTSSGMENQTEVLKNDSKKEDGQKGEGGGSAGEGGAISMRDAVHSEVKSDIVSEDKGGREGQHESESVGEMAGTYISESVEVQQQDSPGVKAVQQELVKVQKLLDVRETRMVEMSRELIQLTEANQELQSRLSAAEQDLHTSQGGADDLRSEFAKRIGTMEKKLQAVNKERDSLKKQLQVLTAEHSHQKKSASEELTSLLKEKEEQIAGLMEEGEKLSKRELQNSNVIKKLKEKNKQNDQLLTAQRQQIEDCEREVSRLKEVVKKKEENEKKYQESLAQLNTIAEQQDKELSALKVERDDLEGKARSLQANLDSAYKELSELHKASAVNKSVAHEALLSAEQTARQELTEVLEKQRVEAHREKEKLLLEISELRASVSRCEQQAAWREEHMKQEVGDMQQRLQEAEVRNQELTTSISQTTKPLLRQIETLHNAHSTQTANWEKVEASLTQRLVEAQTQLSMAVEKERSSTEKMMTLQSRVTALEKQTTSLRQDKSRLTASLELEKAKVETFEESQQRDSAKMEAVRTSLQQSMEELRKEKEMLERQLEYERVRLEAESRKACLESQEKERLRSQLASSISRGLSRQSSTASTTHTQSEILEKSLVRKMSEEGGGGGRGSVSAMDSLHHNRAHATSASAIEQLQSLLKQKEGELANAQNLVGSLERSRAAMANDLAAVSSHNVELREKVDTIPQLTVTIQELQKNNEALLQMYGEKAEEAEELKLDIQDMKDMYKQQIDALTKR